MADGANNEVKITSKALMYGDPRPLNYATHKDLGVTVQGRGGFQFAAKQHFVPITANEFGVAATTYPIIFAGEQRHPIAVMGLQSGENLFIGSNGQFKPDAYVPAYIRRYPFVLAQPQDGDRMIVCVDHAYEGISDKPDLAFFDDKDTPSEYTRSAIEFLQNFESQRLSSDRAVKRLTELDMFETKEVIYRPRMRGRQGEDQKITEYTGISESKLSQLDGDTLKDLSENGLLGFIYAHMISLFNWDRLMDMQLARQTSGQAAPSADLPDESPVPSPASGVSS